MTLVNFNCPTRQLDENHGMTHIRNAFVSGSMLRLYVAEKRFSPSNAGPNNPAIKRESAREVAQLIRECTAPSKNEKKRKHHPLDTPAGLR